ncbi:hypothetical protein RJ640_024171, partial [Escallonia rubra]
GEDTRKTFTDHLYTALVQAGLSVFRDNDEIERGGNLKRELDRAIKGSQIAIIVFSKDYASSKWCLDELAMILDCKDTSRHTVFPVFYDVEPSEVRNQRGSFADAFTSYEEQLINAGSDTETGRELMKKHESRFIQKIVRVIEEKLNRRVLSVTHHQVGINSHVKNINVWIQDGSIDTNILVIYGMGGIGKTTIAKIAYNLNFHRFDSSNFVADVKQHSEQFNGILELQNQVLSNILKGEKGRLYNVHEGSIKINQAICSKRVLVVLDDVDKLDQFDALLGTRVFYPGSKIIITTRKKGLLRAHAAHKVHKVEILGCDESLELFSWHAFGQDHPVDGYVEQSERLVRRCNGLPLALQVLGSSLLGKSIDIWEGALSKLEEIPHTAVQKVLEISYYTLQDDYDKNLFLHIACFFIGEEKDYTVRILEKCGCVGLLEVCESIGFLKGLELLDLEDCTSLKKLPRNIGVLNFLQELNISGCSNLDDFPVELGKMKSLRVLRANKLSLNPLPSATGEVKSWQTFLLPWVSQPKRSVQNLLVSLPRSLVDLSLQNCNLSDDSFPQNFGNLSSLRILNLCNNPICSLPDCIRSLKRLYFINLSSCTRLQSVEGLPDALAWLLVRFGALLKHEIDTEIGDEWMQKLQGWRPPLPEVVGQQEWSCKVKLMGSQIAIIVFSKDYASSKWCLDELAMILDCKDTSRHTVFPVFYDVEPSEDGSVDANILVIYGMGGIGKTTIAKIAYNSNFHRFDSSSFVANVKQHSEQFNSILQLQNQVLSDILKGEKGRLYNVHEGSIKINQAICSKRVLVVLDDVDKLDQFDTLFGTQVFYPGSKIILTTRKKGLLGTHAAHKVHRVESLCCDESLKLFSLHAFGQDHPMDGYVEQSQRLVRRCEGLPQALQILSSSLSGKSIDVWEDALSKLEEVPHIDIQKVLEISHNTLQDDYDNNLFLHIACFFVGEEKDYIVKILDKCGLHPTVGIDSLIDRCLLTLEKGNKLMMHQLIQEMGKEIVRKESPKEPGNRSRLWHHKDSFHLTGNYEDFPRRLRWLCWHGFPLKHVPIDISLENLVILDLRHSKLKQFWEGTKCLAFLKTLDLSYSERHARTFNLLRLPNLDKLILKGCVGLLEVCESIGFLKGLDILDLEDCTSLKKLPKNIGLRNFLQELNISGRSNLDNFPAELGKMKSLSS